MFIQITLMMPPSGQRAHIAKSKSTSLNLQVKYLSNGLFNEAAHLTNMSFNIRTGYYF